MQIVISEENKVIRGQLLNDDLNCILLYPSQIHVLERKAATGIVSAKKSLTF